MSFTDAGRRWTDQLTAWAIPKEIIAQAQTPPWSHDPSTFAMDESIIDTHPIFELARQLLPLEGGSVMDVGCGGGRSSLPLAPRARHITGIDENPAMLARFSQAADEAGVSFTQIHGRFPDVILAGEHNGQPISPCDVVVCHHVFFNVADLEPFVVALTAMARLGVVVVIPERHPLSPWNEGWKHFWNLDRPLGPTAEDAIEVLNVLGFEPEVVLVPRPPMTRQATDPKSLVVSARRRLCLPESRDDEIAQWLQHNPPNFMGDVIVLRWPGGLS